MQCRHPIDLRSIGVGAFGEKLADERSVTVLGRVCKRRFIGPPGPCRPRRTSAERVERFVRNPFRSVEVDLLGQRPRVLGVPRDGLAPDLELGDGDEATDAVA